MRYFSPALHAGFLCSLVNDCPGRVGMEAMRVLTRRYELRTPGTELVDIKAIGKNTPSKKAEDNERSLQNLEESMEKD